MEEFEKLYNIVNKNLNEYVPEFIKFPPGTMGLMTTKNFNQNVEFSDKHFKIIEKTAKELKQSFDETLRQLLDIQFDRIQQFQQLKDLAK